MHQTRLPAETGMLKRFFFGDQPAKAWVDFEHCLAQEEAAILAGVIGALAALPADAEIHEPMVSGFLNEVIHNPRWQDKLIGLIDLLMDNDERSDGINQVVPCKRLGRSAPITGRCVRRQAGALRRIFEQGNKPDGRDIFFLCEQANSTRLATKIHTGEVLPRPNPKRFS
jgi:hypothetical protein